MNTLPEKLYTCEQTRAIDQFAIQQLAIPGNVLMKRAARSAYEIACQVWPRNRRWVVLCGGGNNAGDGYVFAALAAQRGQQVHIYYLKPPAELTGDVQSAFAYARQEKVDILPFSKENTESGDFVIVDALLGSGLAGRVNAAYHEAITWINDLAVPVLAMDIPSGLCGDLGIELGIAVKATTTVTFVTCKRGLLTGRGPAYCGVLHFCDLDIPEHAYAAVTGKTIMRLTQSLCPSRLGAKAADAHKGDAGHLMVVGGELGFGGAAILSAECAAYCGAGMVSLCTRHEHVTAALSRRPELMVLGIPSGQELEPHLMRASVLLVGPGLGQTPWSEQMLQQSLVLGVPLVLDADALNILAQGRIPWPKSSTLIITPHPGEAARLLNCSTAEVQEDRFTAVEKLQALCGGIVLLKGAGTLIHDGRQCWLANVGNPGLATAGSGDVLGGVIGALIAQGLTALDAVMLAACVHGDAADLLAEDVGTRGMLAGELIPYIRELLSQ